MIKKLTLIVLLGVAAVISLAVLDARPALPRVSIPFGRSMELNQVVCADGRRVPVRFFWSSATMDGQRIQAVVEPTPGSREMMFRSGDSIYVRPCGDQWQLIGRVALTGASYYDVRVTIVLIT